MYGLSATALPPMLRITTRTWARDSHDLYDYETQEQVMLRQFATSTALRLLRCEEQISALAATSDVSVDKPFDYLLNIYCKRAGEFIVSPAEKVPGSNFYPQKLWTIVRSLPNARYVLQEGDVIKLGRFRLKVKQLVPKSSEEATSPSDASFVKLYDSNVPIVDACVNEQMQCRICLSEGGTNEDRLICACECKGSIKYVHVGCLQKWINSRWDIKDSGACPQMVFIREVNCELCKSRYPCFVRQNDEVIQIVQMPRMQTPFVVLENVTPNVVRGVHLLSLNNVPMLKLGRGHESDVRIPDVSISRFHATISYDKRQFYLEDHDSKFGTLVAMRRPRTIGPGEVVALQVGRSVVEMCLDPLLPFVPGCIEIPPPQAQQDVQALHTLGDETLGGGGGIVSATADVVDEEDFASALGSAEVVNGSLADARGDDVLLPMYVSSTTSPLSPPTSTFSCSMVAPPGLSGPLGGSCSRVGAGAAGTGASHLISQANFGVNANVATTTATAATGHTSTGTNTGAWATTHHGRLVYPNENGIASGYTRGTLQFRAIPSQGHYPHVAHAIATSATGPTPTAPRSIIRQVTRIPNLHHGHGHVHGHGIPIQYNSVANVPSAQVALSSHSASSDAYGFANADYSLATTVADGHGHDVFPGLTQEDAYDSTGVNVGLGATLSSPRVLIPEAGLAHDPLGHFHCISAAIHQPLLEVGMEINAASMQNCFSGVYNNNMHSAAAASAATSTSMPGLGMNVHVNGRPFPRHEHDHVFDASQMMPSTFDHGHCPVVNEQEASTGTLMQTQAHELHQDHVQQPRHFQGQEESFQYFQTNGDSTPRNSSDGMATGIPSINTRSHGNDADVIQEDRSNGKGHVPNSNFVVASMAIVASSSSPSVEDASNNNHHHRDDDNDENVEHN